MSRWLAVGFALVTSAASSQEIKGVEIRNTGLFTADILNVRRAPTTITGYTNNLENVKFIKATNTVPCRLGSKFGFQFVISGDNPGQPVYYTAVHRYPGKGLINPEVGLGQKQDSVSRYGEISKQRHLIYTLDHEYELVSGNWTIELWVNQTYLGGKMFRVGPCPKRA